MDGGNQDIVGFKKVEEFFSFAVQSCKILKSVVDVAVGGARGGGPDGGGVRGGGLSGGGAWGGALGEGCLGGGRGRREIELQEWHNQSGVILRCLMVIKFYSQNEANNCIWYTVQMFVCGQSSCHNKGRSKWDLGWFQRQQLLTEA